MKKILLLLILILTACQPAIDEHDQHVGCPPEKLVDGVCRMAEEGERNIDIFSEINEELTTTEEIAYTENAKGFLAKPKQEGKYPAVIMIHEYWGLNENIKQMAKLLAQEGYIVLAVDLYDGKVGATSDEARKLVGEARANQEKLTDNMKEAVKYVKTLPDFNGKLASIGWCFGGGQSLQLALSGEELQATIIYYGNLVEDKEQLAKIQWPVLGIFGELDTGIPVESVNKFETTLNELNITNEIHIYPEVGHAFANPSGERYAPEATKDAWQKTKEFLKNNLE